MTEPTRVAFLSHRADRTGAPLCMLDLVRHRDPRRFAVNVLLGEEGPLIDDLTAAGAQVEVLPRKLARGSGRILTMRRVVSKMNAHVVHLTSAVGFTKSAALATRSLRIPLLWHLHDDFQDPKFRRRRAWVRWLSTRIIACSESIATEIASTKTTVIENGVELPRLPDLADQREARRSLGLPEDRPVVLFVGSYTPRKNALLIAGAAQRVLAEDSRYTFVMVGGGDKAEYRAEVEARAAGVEGLHLFPERPDVSTFYRASDLVLMPSMMECHPRVLLEASAWGLPTVATPVGDVCRMIQDGRSGWVIPVPTHEAQLLDQLQPILRQGPTQWRERGRAARSELAERLDMRLYVEAFQDEWSRLAGERAVEETA